MATPASPAVTAWDANGNPVAPASTQQPTAWDAQGNPVSPAGQQGQGTSHEQWVQQHPIADLFGFNENSDFIKKADALLGQGSQVTHEDALGALKAHVDKQTNSSAVLKKVLDFNDYLKQAGLPEAADQMTRGLSVALMAGGGGIKPPEAAPAEAPTESPGLIKQIVKGKEVEQEPAKAAVRGMAGASEGTPLVQGNKTVMSEALDNISKQEKAAYSKVDKAAGFDIKATRQTLSDAQYKIKQPEIDDATRSRLQDKIDSAQKSLADAATKVGPDDLNAADTLHKQVKAGQEIEKMIVQQTTPDGQGVNVDGLLNAVKKMRTTNKYGDRLAQWFGDEQKADDFVAKLQQAQKMGAHAVKTQNIAKWLGGIAGVGTLGAGLEHLMR